MIDRPARDRAAAALEDFVGGLITSAELEARYPEVSPDPAIHAIYARLSGYFDDFREVRFDAGCHVEEAALLRRCVSFLSADLDYIWPGPSGALVRLFRSALGGSRDNRGDPAVWPFFRQEDLATADGSHRAPQA